MKTFKHIAGFVLSFLVGVIITYLYMTKQQMDALLSAPRASSEVANQPAHTGNDATLDGSNIKDAVASDSNATYMPDANALDTSGGKASPRLSDYTEEQAKQIIARMPDPVLEQYIDKFMAKDASNVITDKRRFAERAIEELYQQNDNQRLTGEIKLSFDASPPTSSTNVASIDKYAKLYAHLDMRGQTVGSPFVFVKWVDNQTGQVLLFEKKNIIADSTDNWVSLRPYEGWRVGSYDIRFYQFTSELVPIAQMTYRIDSINDASQANANTQ